LRDLTSKKITKMGWWSGLSSKSTCLASPEFKLQCCQKKKSGRKKKTLKSTIFSMQSKITINAQKQETTTNTRGKLLNSIPYVLKI
jgi:hypothetical protein